MSSDVNLGSLVTWGLVALGWVIVSRQNDARETRKEIRSSLIDLYLFLDELEISAEKYHTSASADPLLSRDILRRIKQIHNRIKLTLMGEVPAKFEKQLARFRRAITLSNFDTRDFQQQDINSEILANIEDAKRDLITVLENAFNDRFRKGSRS